MRAVARRKEYENWVERLKSERRVVLDSFPALDENIPASTDYRDCGAVA